MTESVQLKSEVERLQKTVLQNLADLAKSQKVQIFLLGHVLVVVEIVLGVVAKKYGVDPSLADALVMKALTGTGIAMPVLMGAHAYVDGQAVGARVAAEAGKSLSDVTKDALQQELAATRQQLNDKAAQLAGIQATLNGAPEKVAA